MPLAFGFGFDGLHFIMGLKRRRRLDFSERRQVLSVKVEGEKGEAGESDMDREDGRGFGNLTSCTR